MSIKTYSADGSVTYFDSDTILQGVCLGVVKVGAGLTYSKSWSTLAGATLKYYSMNSPGLLGVAISYPGSIPTVNVSVAVTYPRQFMLWATGTAAIQSQPGIQAVNTSGALALSPSARGLNYIGVATEYAYVAAQAGPIFWNRAYRRIRITAPTQPIAVMSLPDGVYARCEAFELISGTTWEASLYHYATYGGGKVFYDDGAVPVVHCYAAPAAPGAGPQCAIYDTDGTLAYDLLANRLLAPGGDLAFSYVANFNSSAAQSLPAGVVASACAVVGIPIYIGTRLAAADGTYTHVGFWRRSGSTLSVDKPEIAFEKDTELFGSSNTHEGETSLAMLINL